MDAVPALHNGEQQVFFQAGGEWCYLWTPPTFQTDRPGAVLIHHHGATGYVRERAADWLDEAYKAHLLRSIMAASGCAVAGSHACGDHWGNPCAVDANGALFHTLVASPHVDASRIGLMGGGLGGALIWNSVLGPMAGGVRAVAVLQAVASLDAIVRAHKFKAPCIEAYGLPADAPDDAAMAVLAPHDPLPRLQRLAPGTPLPRIAIYHGALDDNVEPAANAVPLAAALHQAGAEVELELFADVEHDVYEMGKPIEDKLTAFFATAL